MHTWKMLVAAAAIALSVPASASTITFETASFGPGFTGPIVESGFSYSNGFGALYVNSLGNPGQDMEGTVADGGGVLSVTRMGGGLFTFDSIDYAAFDVTGTGTQDLVLLGLWHGGVIGSETYTLANTNIVPFDNWTTEYASGLTGVTIDELWIILAAGTTPNTFGQNIDNIVLSPVPEPATLALFGAGLIGFAAKRRAKKTR